MAVVTISRQFGAGGATLGNALAIKLNYRFVSAEIIEMIAKEANVSVEWVKGVDKSAGDWLMRFTSKLVWSDFMDRHVGESRADFDEKKYRAFLESIISKIAEGDNVVIIGRASQFILQDNPKAIHVLLVADIKDRIQFIQEHWKVNKTEAERIILTRRKRRRAFLKYFDTRDPNDPSIYHIILNISKVHLNDAEEMIIWMVNNVKGIT